jgi:hypothetical protein
MRFIINNTVKYEDGGSNSVLKNDLVSSPLSSTTNDFKVKRVELKRNFLKYGESFSADIFKLLNVEKEKLSYLDIYFYDTNPDNIQKNDCRFSLTIGETVIGKMSQFQLANIKGFMDDIIIDFVEMKSTETEAILVIIAGEYV